MTTIKKQYINEVSEFYTEETSMIKKVFQNKNMFKLKPSEYNRSNNLSNFYTDETALPF
ncbi:hypothetical protein SAMN05444380_10444 [Thermophagus xiamenensis]|uniref:Uncharacterized protein n=1 Tax=Thermophagus xiamenensis TaxID=385682 RepID=A0A1I1WI82_9BACT|nr:hypothetical protein SAMN05444380_10444 [Thermophagus xiamenensis]